MADTTVEQTSNEELKSEHTGWGRRVLDTFINPDRSFEVIRDHKSIAWILTALVIITAIAFPQILIIQRTIAQFRTEGPDIPPSAGFSEEELAQMQAATPTFTFWIGLVGAIVGLMIIWLLWSGIILLFVSMFGGRTEFGRLWRLAVWTSLPLAIQGIINGIYLSVAGGVLPLLTSLAAFLNNPMEQFTASFESGTSAQDFTAFTPPSAGEMALFSLAGSLDIFSIWRLLLLVLGVMVIAKLNWKKSAAIIFIPWLIGVGISVGASSLVSTFSF